MDPSGEIPLDIILDIGFVAYDIGALTIDEVFNDGANREENLASLGANVVGMAVPYATGLGVTARLGDDAIDLARRPPASSPASQVLLKNQLSAEQISKGHAFEKHVFASLGIRTRDQLQSLVERIMNNPSASKQLRNGRTAFSDDTTGTIVIRDPKSIDGVTAFRPADERKYFETGIK